MMSRFVPVSFAKQVRMRAPNLHGKFCSAANLGIQGSANLYEILGVPTTCPESSIREAFRKLAKATHPDMMSGSGKAPDTAQFIVILSAYQILSNPTKRAQYDAYLQDLLESQPRPQGSEKKGSPIFDQSLETQDEDVVEWLRWYRNMVSTMVHQHEIGIGQGWKEEFKGSLQEALRRAYFGPYLGEMHALPNCFEAEERGEMTEKDILQLVSGRTMIGAVRQMDGPKFLREYNRKFIPQTQDFGMTCHSYYSLPHTDASKTVNSSTFENHTKTTFPCSHDSNEMAFVDLELYLFGNLVARATRTQFKPSEASLLQFGKTDKITVHLCRNWVSRYHTCSGNFDSGQNCQDELLGTIIGLNTIDFGGKSLVYSPSGDHTHVVWQFRTPMVKHMHWFKVDGQKMRCECRSTRARLPSSKFWLFKPRCDNHNVGGWYIETLWHKFSVHPGASADWAGRHFGLLHPAMYILGAAYKTLDTEAIKKQKRSKWSIIASRVLDWWNKREFFSRP